MIVVTEAAAAAIRAAFEQRGELSAAVELRRLFPGVTDTALGQLRNGCGRYGQCSLPELSAGWFGSMRCESFGRPVSYCAPNVILVKRCTPARPPADSAPTMFFTGSLFCPVITRPRESVLTGVGNMRRSIGARRARGACTYRGHRVGLLGVRPCGPSDSDGPRG